MSVVWFESQSIRISIICGYSFVLAIFVGDKTELLGSVLVSTCKNDDVGVNAIVRPLFVSLVDGARALHDDDILDGRKRPSSGASAAFCRALIFCGSLRAKLKIKNRLLACKNSS
jgi:hypothetical protein